MGIRPRNRGKGLGLKAMPLNILSTGIIFEAKVLL